MLSMEIKKSPLFPGENSVIGKRSMIVKQILIVTIKKYFALCRGLVKSKPATTTRYSILS